jgi:hypothetical protein
MPTTANYSWPSPASTASPNVPVDIKALADAADTTVKTIDDRVAAVESTRARGIVKYGWRTTTSTNTANSSTAVGVFRVDGISLLSGRAYSIRCPTLHITSTVTTDNTRVEVRYSTSGTATTASAVMPGLQAFQLFGSTVTLETIYQPGSNQTVSLLLCIARDTGSGTVSLFGDATRLYQVIVEDLGLAVTNGGTNLP